MKKIKKRYIILLFCLIIWIIIFIYSVKQGNLQKLKNNAEYLIINQFNCWTYKNSTWSKIDTVTNNEKVSHNINWQKYDVYVNNKYYKTLDYVATNGAEYFFDDDIHSYEITDEKILFKEDSYLSLKNFTISSLDDADSEIVNNILTKYNHPTTNITLQKKYLLDDNSAIYIVSNYLDDYTNNTSNLYALAFYRKDNKNYLLMNFGYLQNISNYKLSFVVDAKNKFNNLILSYTCEESTCYDMYEYKNWKFTRVIGSLTDETLEEITIN